MLFLLLILFHFSRQAGRQAGRQKRRIEKAWELVERGYFTRVTLDAFARHYSFTLALLKIQNATTTARRRNIPRGIRRGDTRVCSSIAVSQSSTNNLPVGKLLSSRPEGYLGYRCLI